MTEPPQHFFEYSEDQWGAIQASLSVFNPSMEEISALRLRLSMRMLTQADIGRVQSHILSARAAIQRLYEAIGDRVGTEGQIEGEIIGDEIGAALERASPHLDELSRLLERRIDADEELAAWSKEQPRKSNNERPLPRRLMQEVADSWSRFGGQIGHGTEYKAFFEAVMKPVLEDQRISQLHGCAWSDGMFRNHVQQLMKARGLPGKRGPKPKNSA
jgi:hypothetical protein